MDCFILCYKGIHLIEMCSMTQLHTRNVFTCFHKATVKRYMAVVISYEMSIYFFVIMYCRLTHGQRYNGMYWTRKQVNLAIKALVIKKAK